MSALCRFISRLLRSFARVLPSNSASTCSSRCSRKRCHGVHSSVRTESLLPSPTSGNRGSCAAGPRAFDVRKDAYAGSHADVIPGKARVADDDRKRIRARRVFGWRLVSAKFHRYLSLPRTSRPRYEMAAKEESRATRVDVDKDEINIILNSSTLWHVKLFSPHFRQIK